MIKVEGMKRKKRRMRQKAKGNEAAPIEKFSAQSSKSAKFARSVIRKRESSEAKNFINSLAPPDSTVGGSSTTKKQPSEMAISSHGGGPMVTVNNKTVDDMSGAETPQAIDSADNVSA